MSANRRLTYNQALVLRALQAGHSYGWEIMEFTRLPSGTIYPILRRFDELGWVSSRWQDAQRAHRERHPRRRLYELTDEGRAALSRAIDRLREHQQVFGPVLSPDRSQGEPA